MRSHVPVAALLVGSLIEADMDVLPSLSDNRHSLLVPHFSEYILAVVEDHISMEERMLQSQQMQEKYLRERKARRLLEEEKAKERRRESC